MKIVSAIAHLRDFQTEGHHPVLVLADDGQKYVVKPYRSSAFDYSYFNELLANRLLQHWQINTPEMALAIVNRELLKNSANAKHFKKHFFDKPFIASKYIDESIDLNNLFYSRGVSVARSLTPRMDFIRLGLFDIWVENDDRKPSNFNIILSAKNEQMAFYAIDNALIFSSLDYQNLKPQFVSNSFNDNILYSKIAGKLVRAEQINQKWIQEQKEKFYLCINSCHDNFDPIISELNSVCPISAADVKSLREFLFNEQRNKQVFDEFLTRLKE